MRNMYPGTCYRCGQPCEPGAGHFERQRHKGKLVWLVQHFDCALEWRGKRYVHPAMPAWLHELRGERAESPHA